MTRWVAPGGNPKTITENRGLAEFELSSAVLLFTSPERPAWALVLSVLVLLGTLCASSVVLAVKVSSLESVSGMLCATERILSVGGRSLLFGTAGCRGLDLGLLVNPDLDLETVVAVVVGSGL